jgi:hypothetical protein
MPETKNQTFHRLARARTATIQEHIRRLGNLSVPSNYEYDLDEAVSYIDSVARALAKTREIFVQADHRRRNPLRRRSNSVMVSAPEPVLLLEDAEWTDAKEEAAPVVEEPAPVVVPPAPVVEEPAKPAPTRKGGRQPNEVRQIAPMSEKVLPAPVDLSDEIDDDMPEALKAALRAPSAGAGEIPDFLKRNRS